MRYLLRCAAFGCALGACSGGATVQGEFLDEAGTAAVRDVWVLGREGRTPVQDGRFELDDLEPGSVDLRIGGERGEIARLRLQELPRGARATLHGIWIDAPHRLAFPTRVELQGARTVTVNGIRIAPADRPHRRLRERAVVLAISDPPDAILARPHDERLPDLRVVVTPATETATADGDPAPLERLAAGDSIVVEGSAEQGFVIAARIVVPRRTLLDQHPVQSDR